MAMTVNRARDFEQEKAAATLPKIRMFTVKSGAASTAQADCQGAWEVCSPETVSGFSATLFFFGREIHKALGVPVGLINSSVGGTPIESWIDGKAQRDLPALKGFFEEQARARAAIITSSPSTSSSPAAGSKPVRPTVRRTSWVTAP